jgi:hypothetical protein
VDAFAAEYEHRPTARTFGLSAEERREAEKARREERIRWTLRAARGIDREKAGMALSMARAKLPV